MCTIHVNVYITSVSFIFNVLFGREGEEISFNY